MRRFINGLNPHDTFTIIDFANTATYLSPVPLANTLPNRTQAINYIERLTANGGTELMNGIEAVLNFPEPPLARLRNIVLMTDGYIGNDNEILAAVQQHLKLGNRLYSFGVGSSTNRFLLNRLAEIGRGTCQVVRHDESTEDVAEQFFRHINNPVLTDLQVSWEGAGTPPLIYPANLPDLFAEQPLVLFGRKSDRQDGNLTISGIDATGRQYQQTFNLNFELQGHLAIAGLWGRSRIKDLMQQMLGFETKANVEAVTTTALTYQLLSQYTAFVAVSDDVRVDAAADFISMQVPVEIPEGMNFGVSACGAVEPSSCVEASMPSQVLSDTAIIPRTVTPTVKCHNRVEIVSVTGLDSVEIAALKLHLQHLILLPVSNSPIVFEFTVDKGRVWQLVLDERASSPIDEDIIFQYVKKSLVIWQPSPLLTATVRLTLRIKSAISYQ